MIIDYYYFRSKNSVVNEIYQKLMNGIESSKRANVEEYLSEQAKSYIDKGFAYRFFEDDLPF